MIEPVLARTETVSGTVLVVAAGAGTELLPAGQLEAADLQVEHVDGADDAIARVEDDDPADVVVLAPGLPDPVRVAQRIHSLDRQGAVVVLAQADGEEQLRHALSVAPFLSGDVTMHVVGEGSDLAGELSAAAARTRARREAAAERHERRSTPPPLSASYLGTLLDSVPIGLVTLDAERAVIGWNKRAGEMLGTPEVEALGRPFSELFGDDAAPRIDALIEELRRHRHRRRRPGLRP